MRVGDSVEPQQLAEHASTILDEFGGSLERRDRATAAVLFACRRERRLDAVRVFIDLARSSPTTEEEERWLLLADGVLVE